MKSLLLPYMAVFFVCLSLTAAQTPIAEWHGLKFYSYGRDIVDFPFDGTNPLCKVKIVNEGTENSPNNITMIVTSEGVQGRLLNTFPNGGRVIPLKPGDSTIVSCWLQEIFQRPVAPFQAGEIRPFAIEFIFARDRRDAPDGDSAVVIRNIMVAYWGRNPAITGTVPVAGRIVFSTKPVPSARLTLNTLNWRSSVAVPLERTDDGYEFSTAIGERGDWYFDVSGDNVIPKMVKIDRANAGAMRIDAQTGGGVRPIFDYELVASVVTGTGFWRGVGSDAEGTVCVFPGQENWKSGGDSALRAASKIYKFGFNGAKIWEFSPGWETWGGDMSADGKYVAYALYTGGFANDYRPRPTVALLDGLTGEKLWEKSGSPLYESYEVAFSPDAEYLAVGTTGSGQVSLLDRETGATVWSAPLEGELEHGQGFGQVRRIRFDAAGEYLYAGSGDNYLRKIRVADGKIVWRALIGGWPFVNGLNISRDGSIIAVGTKSAQACVVRTDDGSVLWTHDTGNFEETYLSPDGKFAATFSGKHFDAQTGELIGKSGAIAIGHFSSDSKCIYRLPSEMQIYGIAGAGEALYQTKSGTMLAKNQGEQSQWSFLSADNAVAVVAARDMANPPQTGLVFYRRKTATDVHELLTETPSGIVFRDGFIEFSLAKPGAARLSVSDVMGRTVISELIETTCKGKNLFRADTLADGVYIGQVQTSGSKQSFVFCITR